VTDQTPITEPDRREESAPTPRDPDAAAPVRILIVDDGSVMSDVLRHLSGGVATGAYVVDRVTTVADGFGAFIGGDLDVCIIDHHVGARIGFDLLERISTEGVQIPVVFVAQPGDHGAGVTAVAAGASCYVVEDDLNPMVLEHCLRHAMGRHETLSRLIEAGVTVDGVAPTKAQILSHIAERLGEPVATIMAKARASLGFHLPTHTLESLLAIEQHASTLLTLANDLSDLATIDSGHLRLEAVPFKLRGVVSSVIRILDPTATDRGIEIITDIAPDVPDSLIGDPSRLRLVIVRFVDNVLAQSSADRVRLSVEIEALQPDSTTLRIGVHPETLAPEADEDQGTAFGLPGLDEPDAFSIPVVLETVSRMGGRVDVGSIGGRATGIQFTVQFENDDLGTTTRPAIDYRLTAERPVLVVSNSISGRHSITRTLDDVGLPYVAVPTADAWISARDDTDAIPVDPVLAIVESTGESFESYDHFVGRVGDSLPVVLIVRSGHRGDAAQCRERGVRGYLSQPIDAGDLGDVVKATIALVESGDTSTLVTRHWVREGRRSLHVLVVDDSSTSRFLMTRMLDQRDHTSASAAGGREAISAVENGAFDVVLMDALMPDMDGLETTRIIRAMFAGAAEQPLIIGVSAFADDAFKERGREAGMDAFLTKPLRPDELFAAVEQQLTTQPS